MAAVKTRNEPAFLARLKEALTDTLRANGIAAEVDTEPVPTTRLYRVAVLAPKFKRLRHSERQDLVWRIAERALSPEEQMRVSMILTMTPDEAEGK
jgi:hypothetical protein